MLTLAIDTATKVCSVALVRDGDLLASYDVNAGMTHSEGLIPQIEQMLQRSRIEKNEIDRIAVSVGPGSFTGLRIGLAAAQAMAYAWKCGLCGINTMTAMAYNVGVTDLLLLPVIDAQKGNFYCRLHEWQTDVDFSEVLGADEEDGKSTDPHLPATPVLNIYEPIKMLPPREILSYIEEQEMTFMLLGETEKFVKAVIRQDLHIPKNVILAAPGLRYASALSVGLAAEKVEEPLTGEDIYSLQPYYIRKSEAEELWERKHAQEEN